MRNIARWIFISMLCLASFSSYSQTHIVAMMTNDMGVPLFNPDHLLIQLGDIVVWKNLDNNFSHNVVANPNGIPEGANLFASPLLESFGKEWSHRFSHVGSYHYHCHPHAAKGMMGTVVVGRETLLEEFRETSGNEHLHHY